MSYTTITHSLEHPSSYRFHTKSRLRPPRLAHLSCFRHGHRPLGSCSSDSFIDLYTLGHSLLPKESINVSLVRRLVDFKVVFELSEVVKLCPYLRKYRISPVRLFIDMGFPVSIGPRFLSFPNNFDLVSGTVSWLQHTVAQHALSSW